MRDGPTVSLVLLEASSGDELATAEAFETEVVQVGSDGVLRLWPVADPADPAVIEVGQAIDVAFSPHSSRVAVASVDGPVTIHDAEKLTVETTLPRAGDELAFAPTSDRLALTELEESTVLVWDWAADEVTELSGAEDDPRAVHWAPDGSAVDAVSPRDGVLAWSPDGGEPTRFDAPVSG